MSEFSPSPDDHQNPLVKPGSEVSKKVSPEQNGNKSKSIPTPQEIQEEQKTRMHLLLTGNFTINEDQRALIRAKLSQYKIDAQAGKYLPNRIVQIAMLERLLNGMPVGYDFIAPIHKAACKKVRDTGYSEEEFFDVYVYSMKLFAERGYIQNMKEGFAKSTKKE